MCAQTEVATCPSLARYVGHFCPASPTSCPSLSLLYSSLLCPFSLPLPSPPFPALHCLSLSLDFTYKALVCLFIYYLLYSALPAPSIAVLFPFSHFLSLLYLTLPLALDFNIQSFSLPFTVLHYLAYSALPSPIHSPFSAPFLSLCPTQAPYFFSLLFLLFFLSMQLFCLLPPLFFPLHKPLTLST